MYGKWASFLSPQFKYLRFLFWKSDTETSLGTQLFIINVVLLRLWPARSSTECPVLNWTSYSGFTYPCSPSFLVEPEVKSIHSIGNCKALHPLIGVISSLDSYLNDNRSVSKVNLEPLTPVVVTCYPWAVSWAAAHGIQSALVGGIMSIVDRGCSERHIRQATVFWAQWNITTLWKIKKV